MDEQYVPQYKEEDSRESSLTLTPLETMYLTSARVDNAAQNDPTGLDDPQRDVITLAHGNQL
jgi:hypothetical protein